MIKPAQLKCIDRQRAKLVKNSNLNGIDYVEVIEPQSASDIPLLLVFCFRSVQLDRKNVQIDGGVRIKNIGVLWAQTYPGVTNTLSQYEQNSLSQEIDQSQYGNVLVIRPTSDGDFSTYTLRLVDVDNRESPPPNFDHVLSQSDFSFKVDCPSDFDCLVQDLCPVEPSEEPVIDYMAKDFESFRQVILDKLSLTMPDWKERNPADMSVALVEILAYVGDQLSYYQDAVATEAYPETARSRISMRRHVRLLDYNIHDGCNARAWVAISVDHAYDGLVIPGPHQPDPGTRLLTGKDGDTTIVEQKDFDTASMEAEVFETMHDLTLYSARNEIDFYTWGEPRCCLAKGAISATLINAGNALDFEVFSWQNVPGADSARLKDFLYDRYHLAWIRNDNLDFTRVGSAELSISDGVNFLTITAHMTANRAILKVNNYQLDEFIIKADSQDGSLKLSAHILRIGDTLIFEEVRSPSTGSEADADPTHRQTVRLRTVAADLDTLTNTPVLNIGWDPEDALLFPLCLWNVDGNPCSVARGNVVLVDHGYTASNGNLSDYNLNSADSHGYKNFTEYLGEVPTSGLFRPRLEYKPLTFSAPFDFSTSASSTFNYNPRDALPSVILLEEPTGILWSARRDLLSSDKFATDFVVETDNDGTPNIRFGDDELGKKPTRNAGDSKSFFFAVYRIGNGDAGNVGRDAISRIANSATFTAQGVTNVRNPIAAHGGIDREDIEDVRQFAPQAFLTQKRAVTPADYVEILQRFPGVQKAFAGFGWTGSWYTVFISVDRAGGFPVDYSFKQDIIQYLNDYRLMGYDLEVTDPVYVPLDISIVVCIAPNYLWGEVERSLLNSFSNRILPDGSKAFFHPDNFTFGDPVYLSKIIGIAMNIQGVYSINVNRFRRWGRTENGELVAGEIDIASSEIARLDNDPNSPENGVIVFSQEAVP